MLYAAEFRYTHSPYMPYRPQYTVTIGQPQVAPIIEHGVQQHDCPTLEADSCEYQPTDCGVQQSYETSGSDSEPNDFQTQLFDYETSLLAQHITAYAQTLFTQQWERAMRRSPEAPIQIQQEETVDMHERTADQEQLRKIISCISRERDDSIARFRRERREVQSLNARNDQLRRQIQEQIDFARSDNHPRIRELSQRIAMLQRQCAQKTSEFEKMKADMSQEKTAYVAEARKQFEEELQKKLKENSDRKRAEFALILEKKLKEHAHREKVKYEEMRESFLRKQKDAEEKFTKSQDDLQAILEKTKKNLLTSQEQLRKVREDLREAKEALRDAAEEIQAESTNMQEKLKESQTALDQLEKVRKQIEKREKEARQELRAVQESLNKRQTELKQSEQKAKKMSKEFEKKAREREKEESIRLEKWVEKDATMSQMVQLVSQKERELKQREQAISQREQAISQREQALIEREQEVSTTRQDLQPKSYEMKYECQVRDVKDPITQRFMQADQSQSDDLEIAQLHTMLLMQDPDAQENPKSPDIDVSATSSTEEEGIKVTDQPRIQECAGTLQINEALPMVADVLEVNPQSQELQKGQSLIFVDQMPLCKASKKKKRKKQHAPEQYIEVPQNLVQELIGAIKDGLLEGSDSEDSTSESEEFHDAIRAFQQGVINPLKSKKMPDSAAALQVGREQKKDPSVTNITVPVRGTPERKKLMQAVMADCRASRHAPKPLRAKGLKQGRSDGIFRSKPEITDPAREMGLSDMRAVLQFLSCAPEFSSNNFYIDDIVQNGPDRFLACITQKIEGNNLKFGSINFACASNSVLLISIKFNEYYEHLITGGELKREDAEKLLLKHLIVGFLAYILKDPKINSIYWVNCHEARAAILYTCGFQRVIINKPWSMPDRVQLQLTRLSTDMYHKMGVLPLLPFCTLVETARQS